MNKIRTIESDKIKIDFVPDCGGSISAFKFFNGTEWIDIFRQAEQGCVQDNNPLDASCFPLFPFSNRIAYGGFEFEGESYQLPINMPPEPHAIHGSAWQKTAIVTDYASNYLKIIHQQDDDSYAFRFSAVQEWRINDDASVEVSLKIINMGDLPLPFGMGIHPYFVKTNQCTITTDTDTVILNDDEMVPVSIAKIPNEWDFSKGLVVSQSSMDNCYLNWGRECKIKWPELNAELSLTASNIFGNMVVYIPEGDDFFCLEPVTNINDAYNNNLELDKTGLVVLEPAQTLKGTIEFKLN